MRLAQISNLAVALGLFMLALAAVALVHALVLVTRRRRSELAVLRALGFTPIQVALTVSAAATVTVGIGLALGAPIGAAAAAALCDLAFTKLDVVPGVWFPGTALVALVVGVAAGANLLAVLPARRAARDRVAETLRTV